MAREIEQTIMLKDPEEAKAIVDRLLEMYKNQRCDKCKAGQSCAATPATAKFYMEKEDGTREYFC